MLHTVHEMGIIQNHRTTDISNSELQLIPCIIGCRVGKLWGAHASQDGVQWGNISFGATVFILCGFLARLEEDYEIRKVESRPIRIQRRQCFIPLLGGIRV